MTSKGGEKRGRRERKRERGWDGVGRSRDPDSYFMQIHGHSPPDKLIHCERGKKKHRKRSAFCADVAAGVGNLTFFLLLLFSFYYFFSAWLRWGWVCGVGGGISSSIISPEMALARQISMRMPPRFYTNSFRDFPSLSAVLPIYYDGICPSSWSSSSWASFFFPFLFSLSLSLTFFPLFILASLGCFFLRLFLFLFFFNGAGPFFLAVPIGQSIKEDGGYVSLQDKTKIRKKASID